VKQALITSPEDQAPELPEFRFTPVEIFPDPDVVIIRDAQEESSDALDPGKELLDEQDAAMQGIDILAIMPEQPGTHLLLFHRPLTRPYRIQTTLTVMRQE
jgi:hypothetical protein